MKDKLLRKGLVFGIIFLFVVTVVSLIFTVSVTASTELEGNWIGTEPYSRPGEWTWTFRENTLHVIGPYEEYTGTFKVDTSQSPKHLDYSIADNTVTDSYNGKTSLFIYQLDGGSLKMCGNEPGYMKRPATFTEGRYYELTRVKDVEDISYSEIAVYTVFATREGLIGGETANGHMIEENDHFVALPSTKVKCEDDSEHGHDYEVRIKYNGKSVVAPVWDVGPWNTKDDYWNPSSEREMWQDLLQGMPEAQAAFERFPPYNEGFDENTYLMKISTETDQFGIGDNIHPLYRWL